MPSAVNRLGAEGLRPPTGDGDTQGAYTGEELAALARNGYQLFRQEGFTP